MDKKTKSLIWEGVLVALMAVAAWVANQRSGPPK